MAFNVSENVSRGEYIAERARNSLMEAVGEVGLEDMFFSDGLLI